MKARIISSATIGFAALLALTGCGDSGQGSSTMSTGVALISPTTLSGSEASLEQQVTPYCPALMAALSEIPATNPSTNQIAGLKQALEAVRPAVSGAASAEVESWYTSTTDLAAAAFAPGPSFTTKWADWTMKTKVAIEATCT